MYICNDLALIQVALAEQDWKRDKERLFKTTTR